MKKCPFCEEQIEDMTSKCPFCGSKIEVENTEGDIEISGEDSQLMTDNRMSTSQGDQEGRNPLSNGFKVFITMVATIPLIGQLVGIIMAIIYMNSEGDTDRKSFGKALLIGTLVIFLAVCLCCIAYFVFVFYFMEQMGPEIFEQFQQ